MRFALAFFLLLPSTLAAQTDEQRVNQIFSAYDKPDSPGCALGVIRGGNFIYRKAYGAASLELNVPLTTQSVFYIGSVSKQFTAASILLASEKGFLSLDDNIRKYIPELPDYGRPITLRQMLHHTSGFRDIWTLVGLSGWNVGDMHSTDELIDLIARQKSLNFDPGEEFLYSNTNYFLLAEVVNRATKKPLSVFAAENIFQPLGMSHTRFYDDQTLVVPGRVAAYSPSKGDAFAVNWSSNFDTVGAGGLMSTVDDLLLWDRNFYEKKLGTGAFLKEMQTRGILNNGKQISYALGLFMMGNYRGLPVVEHGGGFFGYRSEILRFPQQGFTVICLCNVGSAKPDDLSRKVADVYLEKELDAKTPVAEPTSAALLALSRFTGKYLDSRDHSVIAFTAESGNLSLWGTPLKMTAPNEFEGLGAIISFTDSDNGMNTRVSFIGGTTFSGAKIQEPHLNNQTLANYVGTYKSTEIYAVYKLSLNEGKLILQINRNQQIKLSPIAHDEFEGGGMSLVFRGTAINKISGMDLFTQGVRGVHLEKIN